MNTYADMVTLLLCFFVMLFSMSTIDAEKWEAIVRSFVNPGEETNQVVVVPDGEGEDKGVNQGDPGNSDGQSTGQPSELPENFDDLYEYMKQYVESRNMQGSVNVEKGDGSVYIRFSDNIFFNPDKYELREDSFDILNFLGDGLVAVEDQIKAVNINGHTAMVPGITDYPVSDRRLSSERASSVAIFLEEQKGFDGAKLLAVGFGGLHPIADNNTAEGRSKNRRVDMLIISSENSEAGEQMLAQMLSGTFDPNQYPAVGNVQDEMMGKGNSQPKEPERPRFAEDESDETQSQNESQPEEPAS